LDFNIHNEAVKRLESELDLLNFIDASRVTRFVSQIYMRKNHRRLVRYFRLYHLDPDHLFLPDTRVMTPEELMKDFNPA